MKLKLITTYHFYYLSKTFVQLLVGYWLIVKNLCCVLFQQKPDTRSGDKSEKSVFNDVFQKQMEFSSEPERKAFLERLFLFMEERGSAITQNPTISKQAIDLYKLYSLVKERGGMVDVSVASRVMAF